MQCDSFSEGQDEAAQQHLCVKNPKYNNQWLVYKVLLNVEATDKHGEDHYGAEGAIV